MLIQQPHHLVVNSEDGKAVTMTNLQNGKIYNADSIRLASLIYTNTLCTFNDTTKSFTIQVVPHDAPSQTSVGFEITLEMPTDVRFSMLTLVETINKKIEALAPITKYWGVDSSSNPIYGESGNGYKPSDYIVFRLYPDQGVIEITAKKSFQISITKNIVLGIKEDTTFKHPTLEYPEDASTTEYKSYGHNLVVLAPTDLIHVCNSIFRGRDMISNLQQAQDIVHTIGISSYFGNVVPYLNQTGSAVELQPSETQVFTVTLRDRDMNEIEFRRPWTAIFELTYAP